MGFNHVSLFLTFEDEKLVVSVLFRFFVFV